MKKHDLLGKNIVVMGFRSPNHGCKIAKGAAALILYFRLPKWTLNINNGLDYSPKPPIFAIVLPLFSPISCSAGWGT